MHLIFQTLCCRSWMVCSMCHGSACRILLGSRSFALSRLANLTHAVAARLSLSVSLGSTSTAVCCASSTSNSSPLDIGRGSFLREADIARERKLLQLRVIYLCDRFGISQDRIWNAHRSNRRARVDQEGRSSPCLRLARLRHGHACCKHERRYVDTDRL